VRNSPRFLPPFRAVSLRTLGPVLALLLPVFVADAQPAEKKTPGAIPQPRVPAGVVAHRDLAYVAGGHERQKLDLYLPREARGPRPVIVWVHGGGWQNGSKAQCRPLAEGFVARGYAVASLGYRLSGHAIFPAQLEDCKAAIRWLRAHARDYGLDPAKFAAWGSSAGGHLVALLGTTGDLREFDVGAHMNESSAVQAVVDWFGPTDFTQMDRAAPLSGKQRHDSPQSPESKLIGGAISDPALAAKVQRANPIRYVSADDPPFLIVHGSADPLVNHHQSELLHAALVAARRPVRLHTIEGAGHGTGGFASPATIGLVATFLEFHLQGKRNAAAEWPADMHSRAPATP
jgi:acetyl esterase/lipase